MTLFLPHYKIKSQHEQGRGAGSTIWFTMTSVGPGGKSVIIVEMMIIKKKIIMKGIEIVTHNTIRDLTVKSNIYL